MNYKKFKEEFISALKIRKNLVILPDIEKQVYVTDKIFLRNRNIYVTIDLLNTYEKYTEIRNIDSLIYKICELNNYFFTERNFINTEKNIRIHLKTDNDQKLFCKKYLDLEFVFFVDFNYGFFNGSIPVDIDSIKDWNLSEEKFMNEVLNSQNPIISYFDNSLHLNTNNEIFINGIDFLLNKNILQKIYEINHTDFYIISTGEISQIIFDDQTDDRAWYVYEKHIEMSILVRNSNPEEYLINTVYYYHGESKQVTIIDMKEVLTS